MLPESLGTQVRVVAEANGRACKEFCKGPERVPRENVEGSLRVHGKINLKPSSL